MTLERALFPDLLGEDWSPLPDAIKRMHGDAQRLVARGLADVDGSMHLPARLLRHWFGLPEPGSQQALEVTIERNGTRETWTRRFPSMSMRSVLDRAIHAPLLDERLGYLTLYFELTTKQDAVDWRLHSARLFGLPLPRAFFGQVIARCRSDDQRYLFQIESPPPLLGSLVSYRGWLEIVDEC